MHRHTSRQRHFFSDRFSPGRFVLREEHGWRKCDGGRAVIFPKRKALSASLPRVQSAQGVPAALDHLAQARAHRRIAPQHNYSDQQAGVQEQGAEFYVRHAPDEAGAGGHGGAGERVGGEAGGGGG